MTLPPDLQNKILRYHLVEKWPIGTIARHLHVHHESIERLLRTNGLPQVRKIKRPAEIDAYEPFIQEILSKYPTLCASRLYRMVLDRGYIGSASHFRHLISLRRPHPATEAYLRLRTLPGEQAQMDWAHAEHITVGRAKRPVMAFVLVLSYSRYLYVEFFLNARMDSFLSGHVHALEQWQGCPRVILYDNLKSAVLDRQQDTIRFNPTLLALARHYRFEPRPVNVARGNEKGRVERSIQYLRTSFLAGRTFNHVEELNAAVSVWCQEEAVRRPWPEDNAQRVLDAWKEEQPRLMSLPGDHFPCEEQVSVHINKTPYARFDLNDYSVPSTYVRQTLELRATTNQVRILKEGQVVAEHVRSFDRGAQIENMAHVEELRSRKRAAHQHHMQDHLIETLRGADVFLQAAAEKNYVLGPVVRTLHSQLMQFGQEMMEWAMQEAVKQQSPHPNTLRILIGKRRDAEQLTPTLDSVLPEHLKAKDTIIAVHPLSLYDQQMQGEDKKDKDKKEEVKNDLE